MDQGLAEGTLRNSHRDTHAVRLRPAPRQVGDKARMLVDRCSQSGTIIRQHLDIERMKQPLQKGLFYVIENDGNAEPGFLVFLPGQQAPVFLQTKTRGPPPSTLRMRVSPTLGEGGGSILIATLDTIQHTLRLEDVWMWKGVGVFDTTGYSKRRELLKEFVEKCWVPDARLLGGIVASVLNPKSMAEFLEDPPVHGVELIPEAAGKRRVWYKSTDPLQRAPNAHRSEPVSEHKQSQQGMKNTAQYQTIAPPVQPILSRKALATPVDKMPDIYDLYDEQGLPISRASVQQFSLSQELRSVMKPEGVWVVIEWRKDFGGYAIAKLAK